MVIFFYTSFSQCMFSRTTGQLRLTGFPYGPLGARWRALAGMAEMPVSATLKGILREYILGQREQWAVRKKVRRVF
jgi:hypothetical protein